MRIRLTREVNAEGKLFAEVDGALREIRAWAVKGTHADCNPWHVTLRFLDGVYTEYRCTDVAELKGTA